MLKVVTAGEAGDTAIPLDAFPVEGVKAFAAAFKPLLVGTSGAFRGASAGDAGTDRGTGLVDVTFAGGMANAEGRVTTRGDIDFSCLLDSDGRLAVCFLVSFKSTCEE